MYRERLFRPRAEKIVALLKDARSRGDLRPDIDAEAASLLLLGFLAASYVADRLVDDAGARAAVRQVIEGLRA